MKIVSKKDVVRISIILVLVVVIIWILDPTPLVKWRVKRNAKSLYEPDYMNNCSSQWKTFFDMGKLIDRGHHGFARSILDSVYSRKSDDYRLDSDGLDILLDISANILRSLPMNSVLITTNVDDIHPFAFIQISENIRPDIILLNREMWKSSYYREFLWKNTAIEDIISENKFLDADNNFSNTLHRLALKFPLFFTCRICDITEFPKDSLYSMPIIGYMYMPHRVSDTSLAELKYTMLYSQNWNFVAENPPFDDKQKYYNSESSELASVLSDVVSDLVKAGKDSLARNILGKFDSWMVWDPYYLVMRADIAQKLGEDPNKWLTKVKNWLDRNESHWAYSTVQTYYDSAKSLIDKSIIEKVVDKIKSKPTKSRRIRRRK